MRGAEDIWIEALSTFSSTREAVLEHRFLADICSELWRRGVFDFAVSHSEVDNSGYDLILEAGSVVRHVQLKGLSLDGKRTGFGIQLRLQEKPSACAIIMMHDARSLAIESYRWFGAEPGQPMPALGDRPVRHTKGNALGFKAERPALREIRLTAFEAVSDAAQLVDRLFGPA